MGISIVENAHLAFIGFGEAAQAFVSGWAENRPDHITAYDIKTEDEAQCADIEARYRAHGVLGKRTSGDALATAQIVFSLVTADQAFIAARAAASHLPPGALWLDCNSCAPDTKRQAAHAIEAAGGRYVDVAVMAPVHPKRHLVPLLLSGPHAGEAASALEGLGMRPAIAGDAIGEASAIKMIRSVMIKGLEALTAECLLAARRAGVDAQVIASLRASDPDVDWQKRGSYNLERMMVHGARRASEMREVAETLKSLGLPNRMASATADWQDEISRLGLPAGQGDLFERADRILAAI